MSVDDLAPTGHKFGMLIDLDAPCGRRLRFRDLVECGGTFQRHAERYSAGLEPAPLSNTPEQEETWIALDALARTILDPVADRFGTPRLTYGFAGPELVREIRRRARAELRPPRIAPDLDQHASHEAVRGRRICDRPGAAVDFDVPGVSSESVATWLLANAPVDRLYLYGDARPLHVAWAPAAARVAWRMRELSTGRWVPTRW